MDDAVESASDFDTAFAKIAGAVPPLSTTTEVLSLDWIESPVGFLLAGATRDAVLLLEFSERATLEKQLQALRERFPMTMALGGNRWLEELRRQLAEYFAGQRRNFDLPLRYPGTAFQEKVWNGLLRIPYGETWSYGELASKLGDAKASRAVGMANGTNPLAILIPCHRVVNSNGALGGYGGGSWRKQLLLNLECGQGELLAVVRGPIETYK